MGETDLFQLRQRLKEEIRRKMRKDEEQQYGAAFESKSEDQSNYGLFFGPSKTVFPCRVIHLINASSLEERLKVLGKVFYSEKQPPAKKLSAMEAHQLKLQRIREARDYSFLSSDAAPVQAVSTTPDQVRGNSGKIEVVDSKPEACKPSTKQPLKKVPTSSGKKGAVDSNPAGASKLCPKRQQLEKNKKVQCSSGKNRAVHSNPAGASKLSPRQRQLEKKRDLEQSNIKAETTLKPHKKPIVDSNSSSRAAPDWETLSRKRPRCVRNQQVSDDDDEKAMLMIRKMFNTKRFIGRDDTDRDMETGFQDIQKEERRSAIFARKEDAEQLRLIEEEERQEQMRKQNKMSKQV